MNDSSRIVGAALAFACATIFVSGCMTAPPRPMEIAAPATDQPFTIDGRLSAKRGNDGATANFAWSHDDGRDRIDLVSPFGQVYARIVGSNDRVQVERPGGATETFSDWKAMTAALLGAPVPMDDLAFWIRGVAPAGAPATAERDAQGRTQVLRQRAWEIVYAYPDDAPSARPSRLVLKYPDVEPVEVRIIVDRWNAAPSSP